MTETKIKYQPNILMLIISFLAFLLGAVVLGSEALDNNRG